MGIVVDIFNPQLSVLAAGLEGKTVFIYGGNSVGKTYVASRLSKPYFIACESGLNAQSGIRYNRITNWADFLKVVGQFTNNSTVAKAREMYDTIVIDEVYACSLMCQDYVINTYGGGALTLADGDSKHNLYQLYEKEFFKAINKLLSCDYTVVFIGHVQVDSKTGFITPKGDKRCLAPIMDNCDFVVYVESNGVDEDGKLIKSSAYFYRTNQFFARTRFEECPFMIKEFTAENLQTAIAEAVTKTAEKNGADVVSYEQQREQNTTIQVDFDALMKEVNELGVKLIEANQQERLAEVIEGILGAGKKVGNCTKKQIAAVTIIRDELAQIVKDMQI